MSPLPAFLQDILSCLCHRLPSVLDAEGQSCRPQFSCERMIAQCEVRTSAFSASWPVARTGENRDSREHWRRTEPRSALKREAAGVPSPQPVARGIYATLIGWL